MIRKWILLLPLVALLLLGSSFAFIRTLNADEGVTPAVEEGTAQKQEAPLSDLPSRHADAFSTIAIAVAKGEMGLKEAVLLKARLIFDRPSISAEGRVLLNNILDIGDPCLTGFFKDVHRVFPELSAEERDYLAAISEDLRVIIQVRERETGIIHPTRGSLKTLPDFDFDKKFEGKYCTVNYTETGEHATTKAYAQTVAKYMDMAHVTLTKRFRAAIPEPGGTDNKLQVYLGELYNVWGATEDVTDLGAGKRTVFIKINSKIPEMFGKAWQAYVKGICFHEYFHGVQGAYNWASSLWLQEGLAMWAQTYYGGNWDALKYMFSDEESLFNKPEYPIWFESRNRKYSTAAFVYYLAEKYGKENFIVDYLKATEGQKDAIKALTSTLAAKGALFGNQFKEFWMALCKGSIKSIKKYAPDITVQYEDTYGSSGSGTVHQLGARIHLLKPMKGVPKAALIYNYRLDEGVSTNVAAFAFTSKSKARVDLTPATPSDENYHHVPDFGGAVKEAVVVFTDVNYTNEDFLERRFDFTYLQPYIKITKIEVIPPVIQQYNWSSIPVTYDLLGTIEGELFPMQMRFIDKGAGETLSGEHKLLVGKGRIYQMFFNGGNLTPKTYTYSVDFLVPADSWSAKWGLPQVKSTGRFTVKVTKSTLPPNAIGE